MSIYIKATKGLNTIEEYLLDIFSEIANPYCHTFKKAKTTYKDFDLTIKECSIARRSFEDILDIIHTNYDEKCTEEELAKTIYSLWERDIFKGILCPDVQKLVFFAYHNCGDCRYKLIGGYSIRKEGIMYKGKGKYCLKEILDLAGQENNYKVKIKENVKNEQSIIC